MDKTIGMNKFILLVLAVSSLMLFSGCSENTDEPAIVSSTVELDGSWEPTHSYGRSFDILNGSVIDYQVHVDSIEERYFRKTPLGLNSHFLL